MGCKVKTAQPCIIDSYDYQKWYEITRNGNFLNSIQGARESILGSIKEEKVVYQDEFTLPMKRNIFGLLVVPVYINHCLCHFILDTGAQISTVRQKTLDKLGLNKKNQTIEVGSIGGKQKHLDSIVIDCMQFGGIAYRNKAMVVLSQDAFSLRFANVDMLTFDGLLGWDVLSTLDFELDDISHECKVLKNHFRFPNPNMIPGDFPFLLVKDERGKVLTFGFDSGSKRSWFSEDSMKKHGWEEEQEIKALGFGVHGMESMQMKMFKNAIVYVDRAKIQLTHTVSGPVDMFDRFSFDGVFGNEVFKGRRIRFVNSKSMVLLV